MVVSNALVTAAGGGLAGRPDPKIADSLYVVGDWVVILDQLILQIEASREWHSHRSANCVTRTRDGAAKRRRSGDNRQQAAAVHLVNLYSISFLRFA